MERSGRARHNATAQRPSIQQLVEKFATSIAAADPITFIYAGTMVALPMARVEAVRVRPGHCSSQRRH
jgi:hypothetical protein